MKYFREYVDGTARGYRRDVVVVRGAREPLLVAAAVAAVRLVGAPDPHLAVTADQRTRGDRTSAANPRYSGIYYMRLCHDGR